MRFSFSLLEKKANFEADVEGLIEKNIDYKAKNPIRKTRYQIKQEEQRKNKELKHKQELQKMIIFVGTMLFIIILCIVMAILGTVFGWE